MLGHPSCEPVEWQDPPLREAHKTSQPPLRTVSGASRQTPMVAQQVSEQHGGEGLAGPHFSVECSQSSFPASHVDSMMASRGALYSYEILNLLSPQVWTDHLQASVACGEPRDQMASFIYTSCSRSSASPLLPRGISACPDVQLFIWSSDKSSWPVLHISKRTEGSPFCRQTALEEQLAGSGNPISLTPHQTHQIIELCFVLRLFSRRVTFGLRERAVLCCRERREKKRKSSPRLSLDSPISRIVSSPVFVPGRDMTEVMINSTPMEDMRLSPSKDRLSFQIFPDPSDFERCCKLKDRLPSIVVEPTEGEVESGELRWPPEEFLVSEEEGEEEEEEEQQNNGNIQNGQPTQNSQQ
ncbi:hypothetical protein F7725_008181 [Dissostichus mawsoni]|uniref:Protein LBH n=1 Tax=Dissostichus mawsoni TaxID=36200 RepID=A0A7J5Y9H5_DISMA|nr:hypothetical protein F7725_008181 [Dissostichus mawsoni]